jgi:hypothetical protein
MPISLQMEARETYLYALVTGAFALDEAQTVSVRFLRACDELRLSKVLVDVRQMQGQPSVIERYRYSEFIAREVIAMSVRGGGAPVMLAYVGIEPFLDPNRFGVMVARNRGVLAMATENLDEALNWLGEAFGTG